ELMSSNGEEDDINSARANEEGERRGRTRRAKRRGPTRSANEEGKKREEGAQGRARNRSHGRDEQAGVR
ncbi:hypothetical protein, partial [Nostocoides japonicum]|uniref:hypothetical protein n=1 Tax=Nostocoides japonicum TaxID=99481 RepID=UPI001F44441C